MLALAVAVAASLALSRAQVTPSEPAPGRDFQIGGTCEISWTPDTSGTWGTTYIQLMTGSNDQMVHLTTVHQFDGTSSAQTTFTYTCPDVTPHSAIYFYQFTSTGTDSPQWTGRFSISNNHDLVAPAQTDAAGIPYGTGALTDPASAVAAPPTAPGGEGTTPPTDPTTPSNPTTPQDPSTPDPQPPASSTPPSTRPGPGHAIPPAGAGTNSPVTQPSETPNATPQPGNGAGALRAAPALLAAAAFAFAAL
ncbi:hypothetical protein AURDEDRAFT_115366 [Auricularia subglabra TFB-10046 SS5]|nr:hypothetical protein AURDEDRAFT_115366 [Auricularia subglabra TFB-10046 SS5]